MKMKHTEPFVCYSRVIIFTLVLLTGQLLFSQSIYTARGYWEESTKESYRKLTEKQSRGDSLTLDEKSYVADYESYLKNYLTRMSNEEVVKYGQMKAEWDKELALVPPADQKPATEEFEWRPRDRARLAGYGLVYGASFVAIAEIEGPAAGGIPLLAAGLMQLGPVINPKKYDGISTSVMRAGNTGKALGLFHGAALGLAIAGDNDESYKAMLGLGTLGSIALGEVAFRAQKNKQYSDGHVELMRHYGFLGSWIGLAAPLAGETEVANLYGLAFLSGGGAGLAIGNKQARKYDYSAGDVYSISSFTGITGAIGFALIANALENNYDPSGALFLIPAGTSIVGTIIGQREIRGVHLTKKQGSTLSLVSGGAALLGLGIVTIAETESIAAIIGIPSVLALIGHQATFSSFKRKNIERSLKIGFNSQSDTRLSFKFTPENYLLGKRTQSFQTFNPLAPRVNQFVNVTLRF